MANVVRSKIGTAQQIVLQVHRRVTLATPDLKNIKLLWKIHIWENPVFGKYGTKFIKIRQKMCFQISLHFALEIGQNQTYDACRGQSMSPK